MPLNKKPSAIAKGSMLSLINRSDYLIETGMLILSQSMLKPFLVIT